MVGTSFLYESFDGGQTLIPLAGVTDLRSNASDDDGDGKPPPPGIDQDEWGPANAIGPVTAINYGGTPATGTGQDVAYVATSGSKFFVRTAISNRASPSFADFTATPYPNVGSPLLKGGGAIQDIALNPTNFPRRIHGR